MFLETDTLYKKATNLKRKKKREEGCSSSEVLTCSIQALFSWPQPIVCAASRPLLALQKNSFKSTNGNDPECVHGIPKRQLTVRKCNVTGCSAVKLLTRVNQTYLHVHCIFNFCLDSVEVRNQPPQ